MKPIKFKQTTKNGCGSLTLANLFNDPNFIKDLQNNGVGERFIDMNKKMQQYMPDLFIEPIYLTNADLQVGNRLLQAELFGMDWDAINEDMKERYCFPLVVTFKTRSGKYHCVAVVHNLKNDLYYVIDSLSEYVQRMSIGELISNYHLISVSKFGLWADERPDALAFFDKEMQLSHIFEQGE